MQSHVSNLERLAWLVDGAIVLPAGVLIGRVYGLRPVVCYILGAGSAVAVQHLFLRAMQRRIGAEPVSPADLLTLSRSTTGALLVGVLVSGVRDRGGPAGWLTWGAAIGQATLGDWLDGRLARRIGPTRIGGVLDIEADSWLTLWTAASAVAGGHLPGWCLIPPLLHYLRPIHALRAGRLPTGKDPWWGRATGTAQMALIFAALAPVQTPPGRRTIRKAAVLVALAQSASTLALAGTRTLSPRDKRD